MQTIDVVPLAMRRTCCLGPTPWRVIVPALGVTTSVAFVPRRTKCAVAAAHFESIRCKGSWIVAAALLSEKKSIPKRPSVRAQA
jgi:hypothetical protein